MRLRFWKSRTEEELVRDLAAGDSSAFDALFRKYYVPLCAYACRLIEEKDAEECVQDVMLWLWEHRAALDSGMVLRAYLYKMVHNRVINRILQNEAKSRVESYYFEEMCQMVEEPNGGELQELMYRVQQSISALPESYREAFVMYRFRGMSCQEIADLLQVSPKTVYYRIGQALKLLREELKDYFPVVLLLGAYRY